MKKQNETEETIKKISSYFLKWVGIVMCILCAVSFFITTEWVLKTLMETEREFRISDSDASKFFYYFQLYILEFAIWLKKLPLIIKIIGFIVGILICVSNTDD